jgi:hypothetical protein
VNAPTAERAAYFHVRTSRLRLGRFRNPRPQNAGHALAHVDDALQARLEPLGEEGLYQYGQPAWRLVMPGRNRRAMDHVDVVLLKSEVEMILRVMNGELP